jgi:hypothetical protein
VVRFSCHIGPQFSSGSDVTIFPKPVDLQGALTAAHNTDKSLSGIGHGENKKGRNAAFFIFFEKWLT